VKVVIFFTKYKKNKSGSGILIIEWLKRSLYSLGQAQRVPGG
jgi:hypothetical protein